MPSESSLCHCKPILEGLLCYRPQTKLRKGNVFTSVCQEFCPQWGVSQHVLGRGVCISVSTGRRCVADIPWAYTHPRQTPSPWAHPLDTHKPLGRHPQVGTPWADTSSDGHCSGRYASYWNVVFCSILVE